MDALCCVDGYPEQCHVMCSLDAGIRMHFLFARSVDEEPRTNS